METVTSEDEVEDIVAVIVSEDPAFSLIDEALTANVAFGTLSSSMIVMVTLCVPLSVADPPETPDIAIIAVSLPSDPLSFVGVKFAVPVVSPALIVMSEIVA